MWCVLLPPNSAASELRARGWAIISTTAATAAHPQQQQQKLLEHHPSAIALLALQQELHRRPTNPPMPQQIDQVDQYRQPDQRQKPEQGWEDEGGHLGNFGFSILDLGFQMWWCIPRRLLKYVARAASIGLAGADQ